MLAISADTPAESRAVAEKNKLEFPLLADPSGNVIRQFGLLHPNGKPTGGDIAIPAQFLFNKNGVLTYSFVSRRPQDRLAPVTIAEQIAAL